MKCPECKKEMEKGFFKLYSGTGDAQTFWTKKEPKPFWKFESDKGLEVIQRYNLLMFFKKKHWLRNGFRCRSCNLIVFYTKS